MRLVYKSFGNFLILLLILASTAMTYASLPAGDGSDLRLRWKNSNIQIALSTSLTRQNPNIRPRSDVTGAVQRSLENWEKVADIKFQVVWTDKQTLSPAGNSGDGVSLITIAPTPENLLLFSSDSETVSARTRTFFNRRGFITEADIVLNPYQQFSTDGALGTFDLEATLTHEIGHLLGLEHSFIMGATMHSNQGKNGTYNVSGFSSRTLSENDIAAIRALYGTKFDDEICCGTISGRLSLFNGKAARDFQVWAEDAETGRVISGVLTGLDGSFRIEGLPSGEYRVYSQKIGEKPENSFPTERLGEASIQKGKSVDVTKKLQARAESFNLQYIGLLGQVSELAVPVNSGKSYMIYLGGKNFETDEANIFFNSPYITVTRNSLIKHNYGADISVISFEVKVSDKTPLGEYGIFVKTRNGTTECLAGSLMVESFENPWNSALIPSNE
jgi:hypothetical protein